jgi:two-component system, chemotaxis family, CheB/CheR fusion protein
MCPSSPHSPPDRLPDLSGLTLLVVDDNNDALQALTTLLTLCGAHVLRAGTASAALAYLDTVAKIDVLVSDLSMPQMNGFELIQRVRRHPSRHRLPAIAISGVYTDAKGFDRFLSKPLDFDPLCAAIRSVIDVRRGPIRG